MYLWKSTLWHGGSSSKDAHNTCQGVCSGSTLGQPTETGGWERSDLTRSVELVVVGEKAEHTNSESSFSNSMFPHSCPHLPGFMSPSSTSPYWILVCLKSRPYENHPSSHNATTESKTTTRRPCCTEKAAGWEFSFNALPPNYKRSGANEVITGWACHSQEEITAKKQDVKTKY